MSDELITAAPAMMMLMMIATLSFVGATILSRRRDQYIALSLGTVELIAFWALLLLVAV